MSSNESPNELADPLLLGRFRYVRELGRGGVGRVLLALDTQQADQPCALKVVAAAEAERLAWERDLLGRIAHPNVARVFALLRLDSPVPAPFGISAGSVVLVEERVPGRPASEVASALEGSARSNFALRAVAAAARGLSALHAQHFVHGDVKPDNLVAEGAGDGAKLVDLGLARPIGQAPGAGGTLAYLAPEAWMGERSVATDLFALGVTLLELLSGADGVDASASSSDGSWPAQAPDLEARVAELPELAPDVREIVSALLARDPSQRPASARDVAMRLAVALGEPAEINATASPTERAARLMALPAVGLAEPSRALADALTRGGVVVVAGPDGVGRDRLLREALLRIELERLRRHQPPPLVRDVVRLPDALAPGQVVVLRGAETLRLASARAFVDACAIGSESPAAVVCVRREPWPEADACVELTPLGEADFASLVRSALPGAVDDSLLRSLRKVSGGLAGRLISLLAEASRRGLALRRPGALQSLAEESTTLPPLPVEAKALAEALAVAGAPLRASSFDPEGVPALVGAGLATLDASGLSLRPDVSERLFATMAEAHRAARARDLLPRVSYEPARAFLRGCVGERDAAQAGLLQELRALRSAGAPARALALVERAHRRLGPLQESLLLAQADALRALADYPRALSQLAHLETHAAELLRGDVLRLMGQPSEARAAYEACVEAAPALALGTSLGLARLTLDAGDASTARERAAEDAMQAVAQGDAALAAQAYETLALSLGAEGRLPEAVASVERGLAAARGPSLRGRRARLLSTLGALRASQGDPEDAYTYAREAATLAREAGDAHEAASFLVNLGAQELERGRLGAARQTLLDGARRLGRIGRDGDLARALYDLASLGLLLGDDALTESCGERAVRAAEVAGDADALTLSHVALAETARRRGELDLGQRRMRLAQHSAEDASPWVLAFVSCRAALASMPMADTSGAHSLLRKAEALGTSTPLVAFECARLRVRLALADGDADALARGERDAQEASAHGFEPRLMLGLLRAEVARSRQRPAEAEAALADVRRLIESAAVNLDAAGRTRLRRVPAYQPAFAARLHPAGEVSGDALARFAGVARSLAGSTDARESAQVLLEGALAVSGAERGLFLAQGATGELEVRLSRGFAGAAGLAGAYSRSVVARALDLGQAVSSSSAPDAAFLGDAPSVHQLALRSVLGVPVLADGEAFGVLYLDDRLRPEAFAARVTVQLEDLGVLTGLAFARHARLRRERRARARIERLEARLARRVERQAIELSELRPAVVDGEPWVAHSAPMRALLKRVRKLALMDSPVLILGESGSGKERVARSLHRLGARSAAPFVSESCSAIPESLLETTLFGHVRGAFTGAVRDHQGLFEAADGGTLLLDEVGEMSPAMQARLLRVVQEREVRPVGATSARAVDVRLLCATHADLRARVAEGTFREDLYYRLAVAELEVPPLRERPEDLPELIQRLLTRHAPERTLRANPAALAALTAFAWPGNVRQLENELLRALLVAQDEIRAQDLSPALRGESTVVPSSSDADLDLRREVDALERRMIRAALERSAGNRTRAAKLLGVSRYGLSKMRVRLGID